MNTYVITIWSKDKVKHLIAHSDKEMFTILQNAIDEKLVYEVNKAELTLSLSNREVTSTEELPGKSKQINS